MWPPDWHSARALGFAVDIVHYRLRREGADRVDDHIGRAGFDKAEAAGDVQRAAFAHRTRA